LARLHPAGVAASALFFGALAAGSGAMQRSAGVSAVFVAIVQATVILALLAADSPRLRRRPNRTSDNPNRTIDGPGRTPDATRHVPQGASAS
jgi:ABC-type uncharacterized transport system permease subunit